MSNRIQTAKEEIFAVIMEGLKKVELDQYEVSVEIERPREAGHGDFASNIAMRLAKQAKTAPRVLAQSLADSFVLDGTSIDSVAVAGPGFLNFTLRRDWLYGVLREIQAEGKDYGRVKAGNGKRVMVEYISANPTGPMHVGNARRGRCRRLSGRNFRFCRI